jgi:hypothetical protein
MKSCPFPEIVFPAFHLNVMNYLRPNKNQTEKRKQVAERILFLCGLAKKEIGVDLQRVALMEKSNNAALNAYYHSEFPKLTNDLIDLNICTESLEGLGEKEYKKVWEDWMVTRNVLAKYLGPRHRDAIYRLDCEYVGSSSRMVLRLKLPHFAYEPRPGRMLTGQEWEEHPDRERSFKQICLAWLDEPYTGYTFDDLNTPLSEDKFWPACKYNVRRETVKL